MRSYVEAGARAMSNPEGQECRYCQAVDPVMVCEPSAPELRACKPCARGDEANRS